MIVHFSNVFLRDIKKLRDQSVRRRVQAAIEQLETAATLQELAQVKQMEGNTGYYRVRVGDYRIGFKMEAGIVLLMRCLHRREIYRYFP